MTLSSSKVPILPDDLIQKILGLVEIHDLQRASRVCRAWYNLINAMEGLWEVLYKNNFVHPDALCNYEYYTANRTWKNRFVERYEIEEGWSHKRFQKVSWKVSDRSRVGTQQFSLKEGIYVAGSTRGNIFMYNINPLIEKSELPVLIATYSGHTDAVRGIHFDSEKIVSGSRDKTIQIWDKTEQLYNSVPGPHKVIKNPKSIISCGENCSSIMYKDNLIAAGFSNGDLRLINMETGTIEQSCLTHYRWVRHVQFTDNNIMTGGADSVILLWDRRTVSRGPVRRFSGHTETVTAVQFYDDRIVSGSYDKTVKEWSLSMGSCVETFSQNSTVRSLQYDKQKIMTGTGDCFVNLFKWKTKSDFRLYQTHGFVSSVRFSRDLLSITSADGFITMLKITKEIPKMNEPNNSAVETTYEYW
jgi:WD40 repeat protein